MCISIDGRRPAKDMHISRTRLLAAPVLALGLAGIVPAALAGDGPRLTGAEARFVATGDRCEQFLGTAPDTVDGRYTQQLVEAIGDGDSRPSLARITAACGARLAVRTADRHVEARTERR